MIKIKNNRKIFYAGAAMAMYSTVYTEGVKRWGSASSGSNTYLRGTMYFPLLTRRIQKPLTNIKKNISDRIGTLRSFWSLWQTKALLLISWVFYFDILNTGWSSKMRILCITPELQATRLDYSNYHIRYELIFWISIASTVRKSNFSGFSR